MPIDPRKVTESRIEGRSGKSTEERQALAVEQLADSVEAMRCEMSIMGNHFIALLSRLEGW